MIVKCKGCNLEVCFTPEDNNIKYCSKCGKKYEKDEKIPEPNGSGRLGIYNKKGDHEQK